MPGLPPHRAHVAVGFDPAFPCSYVPDSIGVFVVPVVPRASEADREEVPAPQADPGAIGLFRQRLEAARMLATRIHVIRPRYRSVALAVTLRTLEADSTDTIDRIRIALARHLDANVGGGGEGWPFGNPLRPSDLVRVAQDAAGNDAFVDRIAVGIDGAAPEQDCADTQVGPHDLVYMARATVRLLPPDQGGAP
jgi:hypothetical protein